MWNAANLVGERFGRLVVKELVGVGDGKRRWRAACDCGGETIATTAVLRAGKSKSCGCLLTDWAKENKTKHGHYAGKYPSKTMRVWRGVINRCTRPSADNYPWYGGRGISVCERWSDFNNFLADMGECPDGLTLDRIDTNGNYEPGNCRWATWETQMQGRRPWGTQNGRSRKTRDCGPSPQT